MAAFGNKKRCSSRPPQPNPLSGQVPSGFLTPASPLLVLSLHPPLSFSGRRKLHIKLFANIQPRISIRFDGLGLHLKVGKIVYGRCE